MAKFVQFHGMEDRPQNVYEAHEDDTYEALEDDTYIHNLKKEPFYLNPISKVNTSSDMDRIESVPKATKDVSTQPHSEASVEGRIKLVLILMIILIIICTLTMGVLIYTLMQKANAPNKQSENSAERLVQDNNSSEISQSLSDEIQGLAKRVDSSFYDFNASLRHLDKDLKKLERSIQAEKGRINCVDPMGIYTYTGTISVTKNRRTCQKWSSQSPHNHRYNNVANSSNYCRDPDGEGMPWCYTVDQHVRWEFCEIPVCNNDCWFGHASRFYNGTKSTTANGHTCQDWTAQKPHKNEFAMSEKFPVDGSVQAAKNYCRDPSRKGYPWCYTTDPNIPDEKCDVQCGD